MEHFELDGEFRANGVIPITKYKSRASPMTVYFADIDSAVINGYFSFGIDEPEGNGMEGLLWHLDSSGGLLPRPLRGEMLRPVWQYHGAENPLADRDQSCFVCCSLGESAFLGTFSCSAYLLQNLEAVFEINGLYSEKDENKSSEEETATAHDVENPSGEHPPEEEENLVPPVVSHDGDYCLSEAGEGAMAWECTLQELIPSPMFWNRLLTDKTGALNKKMRRAYDLFFRPENLTVVITGKVGNRNHILDTLHEYELDYKNANQDPIPYIRPWTTPIPEDLPKANDNNFVEVRFTPRNPIHIPSATVCFGWKGCKASDLETSMALKILTAHSAVGPFWSKFVTKCGIAERISWCQLEYCNVCSLITMHGAKSDEEADQLCKQTLEILEDLAGEDECKMLKMEDILEMTVRIESHVQREMESDPFVLIASSIMKAERYGLGEGDFVLKRVNPLIILNELKQKPLAYWKDILSKYFLENKPQITKVLPKSYDKPSEPMLSSVLTETETPQAQPFASSSKRASSRPRRSENASGAEASVVNLAEGVAGLKIKETKVLPEKLAPGHLEQILDANPFPFGDFSEEAKGFEERLKDSATFLAQLSEDELRTYPVTTYCSDGEVQHPLFPVNSMPFYTILEDIQSAFVYATFVIDTSHLSPEMRKFIAPIVSALGAVVCPRPPLLDTDLEIGIPNEFNPPKFISDSQVSLGLNGEIMQGLFISLIVKPEHYRWAVGMFHQMFEKLEFTPSFLKFVASEAVKSMASSYILQTAQTPNYDCFDSTEINLYSLVKLIYKEESNARLFVGRRRLDLINEFLLDLDKDPIIVTKAVNLAWKELVGSKKKILQIASDITALSKLEPDLIGPWKEYFPGSSECSKLEDCRPLRDHEVMQPKSEINGIAVSAPHCRPACLTTAISIPTDVDEYSKICVASQLFSMAQKWAFSCIDEQDVPAPVLKLPCDFSNILTLNIESTDIIGALKAMKQIIKADNQWLNSILIATKLMIINDPAAAGDDAGPQGTIATSLMARLQGIPTSVRQKILMKIIQVTPEDIQETIKIHLLKLFDPSQCWYSFMCHAHDKVATLKRLEDLGFKFNPVDLTELCTSL